MSAKEASGIQWVRDNSDHIGEAVQLRARSVSAILVWAAIVLLLLNGYLDSSWVFLTCIALVIIAVAVYFLPRHRK